MKILLKALSQPANCFKCICIDKAKAVYTSNDLVAYKNHMLMTNVSLIIKLAKHVTEDHSY